jgi:hypothetical protein
MPTLDDFWKLARKASFHYADDSGKEWHLGSRAESAALRMLRENPEWIPEVRANWGELWRLPEEFKNADST